MVGNPYWMAPEMIHGEWAGCQLIAHSITMEGSNFCVMCAKPDTLWTPSPDLVNISTFMSSIKFLDFFMTNYE